MKYILFVAVFVLTAALVHAKETRFKSGDTCQLTQSVNIFANKSKRTKLKPLAKGSVVEVMAPGAEWIQIISGSRKGYVKTPMLNRLCRPVVQKNPPAAKGSQPDAPFTSGEENLVASAEAPASPTHEDNPKNSVDQAVASPANPETNPKDDPTPAPQAAEKAPSPGPEAPAEQTIRALSSPEAEAQGGFGETYKIKIAVMDLRGNETMPHDLLVSLTNTVPETLDRMGPFKAVSSQDVLQMLQYEAQQQALGCDDVDCLTELGDVLGADFMLSGSVTLVQETAIIQLQLMSSKQGRVENRVSREHTGTGPGLFEAMRAAAKQLMRPILGEHSGQVAVRVSEEGATIGIDGAILGVSPMEAPMTLAGGNHSLTIDKTGFIRHQKDFRVVEDAQATLDVQLVPSAEYIRQYEEDAWFTRAGAWSAIIGGGLTIAGGVVLVAVNYNQAATLKSDIAVFNEQEERLTADFNALQGQQQTVAVLDALTIPVFLLGAATTAFGIYLYVAGDDPYRYEAHTKATVDAGVVLMPGGAGIVGRF